MGNSKVVTPKSSNSNGNTINEETKVEAVPVVEDIVIEQPIIDIYNMPKSQIM